jgi:flagellar basal body-associated protein FliL
LSATLQNLREDAEMRVMTDTKVSPLWILLPVVAAFLALVWAALILVFFVTAFSSTSSGSSYTFPSTPTLPSTVGLFAGTTVFVFVGFLTLYVAFLYVIYLLIRRRNQHFARQQRFFADLALALREAASRKGANVEAYLGSMEATSRQAQIEETEKSAVLWVILYIIPVVSIIAGLYILYFLTGDFFKHERREDGMLADATRALSALGSTFTFNRYNGIPSRSFVLYLILSIVTFGLFTFYWEYVLIQDPNNHFVNHVHYEDALLQSISPLLG